MNMLLTLVFLILAGVAGEVGASSTSARQEVSHFWSWFFLALCALVIILQLLPLLWRRLRGKINLLVVSILLLLALPLLAQGSPVADCIRCHGEKAIGQKGGRSLYVDPQSFNRSSHSSLGCEGCHTAVSPRHPSDGKKTKTVDCKECHAEVEKEYGQSKHGAFAQCIDCHAPHATIPYQYATATEANKPCLQCHVGDQMVTRHKAWLPQTSLHLAALPCIACHTGSENLNILLHPVAVKDGKTSTVSARQMPAVDKNADGLVSIRELRDFNRQREGEIIRWEAVLMPEVMTHSYQVLNNRWDCTFCHAAGPRLMQTGHVLLPDEEGQLTKRLPVEKGAILDLLYGTPDFYIMGASRSRAMNIAGILIVCAGLALPLSHGSVRLLTCRRRRKAGEGEITHSPLYLTPTPIRIWHWLNALGIVALSISGMQLRFSDSIHILGSFKAAIHLHDTAGLVVACSYLIWLSYYLFIGRNLTAIYIPKVKEIRERLVPQISYYLSGCFRGETNPFTAGPENKFNPLQKLTYMMIMFVFLPLVILTGLTLMFVDVLREYVALIGGLRVLITVHYLLACIFVAFLIVHIYLSTLGRTVTSYLKQMWTGWES